MSDQIVLVAFAAFGAALVSGLGGFGGAFILVIALTPVVGAKTVIPLIAVYAICNNLSRVYIYRKSIAWKLGIQFTLASLPGFIWAPRSSNGFRNGLCSLCSGFFYYRPFLCDAI